MNEWMFLIPTVLWSVATAILLSWITDEDGYFKKRKLHNYLGDIMYYQGHKDEKQIVINYKNKTFVIKVDSCTHNNYYKTIVLYINEEPVLTLHILMGVMINSRTVEVSHKRHRSEIVEIIKAAIKRSKKEREDENRESYKTDSKSYFK